jgi:hypothetical protein
MRGFPLLNFLLCLALGLGCCGPLVWRATRVAAPPAAAPDNQADSTSTPTLTSSVRIRCVHAPESITLSSAGHPLHAWSNPDHDLAFEDSIDLPIEHLRTEFTIAIRWPDNTPETMAEITIEPDGLAARTLNVWSTTPTTEEVVSTSWPSTATP